MLDAAKLRRQVVLRSWLATVYIVDGQGSATARGTRRHVGGVHIVFVGGVHIVFVGGCAHCICGRFCTLYLWEVCTLYLWEVYTVHILGVYCVLHCA